MSLYLEGSERSVSCKFIMDITEEVMEESGIEPGLPDAGQEIVLHLLEGIGRDPRGAMRIQERVWISSHPAIVSPAREE